MHFPLSKQQNVLVNLLFTLYMQEAQPITYFLN